MEINCPKCKKEFNVNESLNGKKAKCNSCEEIFTIVGKNNSVLQEENFIKTKEKIENKNKDNVINEVFEDIIIKPKKISYFLLGNSFLSVWIILTIITLLIGFFIEPVVFIFSGLIIFISIIVLLFTIVSYKKEKYTFSNSKITYSYGSIFSDNNIEININKITQVLCELPFVENKLFKTGKITVKTAGSKSGFVFLKNIENTIFLYEEIQKRMQNNGFKLKKEHLVQEAKPHIIGVLGESFKGVLGNIIVLIYFGIGFFSEVTKNKEISDLNNFLSSKSGFIVGLIIFFIFVAIIVFRYFDFKQRVYQVFDDSVFYNEGFLSKHYSFLPMERVSDTENNQSFLSRILGIHDVIISSEGSSNNIQFFNIINGKKMMENIKYLKEHISISIKQQEKIIINNSGDEEIEVEINEEINKEKIYNKDFIGIFNPNLTKTILSNIVFILGIYTIPIAIISIIKSLFTKFEISNTSFEYKYGEYAIICVNRIFRFMNLGNYRKYFYNYHFICKLYQIILKSNFFD